MQTADDARSGRTRTLRFVTTRHASLIAWSLWATTLAVALVDLVLVVLGRSARGADSIGLPGQVAFIALVTAGVGSIIASRLPRNAVGWAFCLLGLGLALGILVQDYAVYALVAAPGALPGGELAAWVGSWLPAAGVGAIFLLLLFPDGRLPSPRWRLLAWIAALDVLVFTVSAAMATAPPGAEDLKGFNGPEDFGEGLVAVFLGGSFAIALGAALASAIALLLRLKEARGERRQQLKWFVYAGSLLVIVVIVPSLPLALIPPVWGRWVNILTLFAFTGIPLAAGVAILKYRLYDIDVVINRTLVYGLLTGLLAATYYGLVVSLQGLFSERIARSDFAVAISTLVVAGLFRPVRARVQHFVDRRFYRSKYDAAKTLEAFSARLRDQIDLETLSAELLAVVRETMQPAHVSLWLLAPHEAAAWAPPRR